MSEPKGLYNKYLVIKVVDDTVIDNCFILRPDKDPAAVTALQAYAAATGNKVLANDLYAWVGKPMQKPMKLRELHALINAGEDVAVYCEAKDDDHTYATIFFDGKRIDRDGDAIDNEDLTWFTYGIRWRAWAARPTDEERAAAPWEGWQ